MTEDNLRDWVPPLRYRVGEYLDEILQGNGLLSRHWPGYAPRESQLKMARAVHAAFDEGAHTLIEAPTGIGKSLAYIIPAAYYALKQNEPVVLVTANIALQEQLIQKDLPQLQAALAELEPFDKLTFQLVKGRSHYLCLHKFTEWKERMGEGEPATETLDLRGGKSLEHDYIPVREILDWSRETSTGDKSEIAFRMPQQVWKEISMHSEECHGRKCRYFDHCYSFKAVQASRKASLIVTNYHLLFSHLKVLESSGQYAVLPEAKRLVLDEGHRLIEIARDGLGRQVDAGRLQWAAEGLKQIDNSKDMRDEIEKASKDFFARLEDLHEDQGQTGFTEPGFVSTEVLGLALDKLAKLYKKTADGVEDNDPDHEPPNSEHGATPEDWIAKLGQLAQQCRQLREDLAALVGLKDPEAVVFTDYQGRDVSLRSRLVDPSSRLRTMLFDAFAGTVVTSATLQIKGSFDDLAKGLGLTDPRALPLPSPFDYKKTMLLVPKGLPNVNDEQWPEAVAKCFEETLKITQGRALGLFTSYKNLEYVHHHLSQDSRLHLLRQGEAPTETLLQTFREDINSVLLGTESFWSGIDVPGEALSCVIIDRLPFPSPNDLIVKALKARDGDKHWFEDYALPKAITSFRQGCGRLIRTLDDTGCILVLDNRLLTKNYKKFFLQGLPADMGKKTGDITSIADWMPAARTETSSAT